jgi:ubiquinone/menaquinone biosynthesis C-methylase UbiE
MSIVFDRAVGYYDRTRGLPPEAEIGLSEALREHTALGPGSRVLELGVGTGRIALPLVRYNRYRYVGVDLSAEMMRVLCDKREDLPVDLARADVAWLPFAARSFAAVVAVHVFHLVGDWARAMDEVQRVLRTGGMLLHGRSHHVEGSTIGEVRQKLTDLSGPSAERRDAGFLEWAQIKSELAQRFGSPRECRTASWTVHSTPRELLSHFQARIWSQTWLLPETTLKEAAQQGRAWAIERFGSLDAALTSEQQFVWEIYTKRVDHDARR